MNPKRKRLILIAAGIAILGGAGAVFASRAKEKPKDAKESPLPFRVGKVSAEDLQVSVREVGVVDPETKVDVKSAVSGRVVSLKVREGAVVRAGDLLAEVEPDVNQAQSLSDVQASVVTAELTLRDAERQFSAQERLYKEGLIGRETLKDYQIKRDLAADSLKAARTRYQIVQDRGIPISGEASTQKARVTSPMDGVVITKGVELGETVTSGVS